MSDHKFAQMFPGISKELMAFLVTQDETIKQLQAQVDVLSKPSLIEKAVSAVKLKPKK